MFKKFPAKPGVDHNSAQSASAASKTPHNGHQRDHYVPFRYLSPESQAQATEEMFRRRERQLIRQERNRRIRSGVIVPFHAMKPTPIVKRPDGSWAIGIETFLGGEA